MSKELEDLLKKVETEHNSYYRNILREKVLGRHPKYRNRNMRVPAVVEGLDAVQWEAKEKEFDRNPRTFLEHNGLIVVDVNRVVDLSPADISTPPGSVL